jgi:hypothetical protein
MTTSPSTTAAQNLREEIQNFYWGAWSELGVSGWGRTHNDWAIDPEPLIVFSSSVIASEPRLRDEVIDWCSDNWRHISAVRLRHLLKDNPEEDSDAWGQFAATVNRFSGAAKWPRATSERDFTRTGRSSLRPLSEGSMVYLRMRSIFGLTARTEILRYLLFTGERSTAAMLAAQVNYAKRNVAEACESLSRAGLLHSKQFGNRLYFSLADSKRLLDFLGPYADIRPDWASLFRVVNTLFRWIGSETSNERVLTVQTHAAFSEIRDDLESLRLEMPSHVVGPAFLPIWCTWAVAVAKSLAAGEWPVDAGRAELQPKSPGLFGTR